MSTIAPEISNNVVHFPKRGRFAEYNGLPAPQDVINTLKQETTAEVNEVAEALATHILQQFEVAGFCFPEDEQQQKIVCFVIESIKAMVHSYYGEDHPFTDLANGCFEKTENGSFTFHSPIFQSIEFESISDEEPN